MKQDEIIEMARQVARQPDRIYAPDEKEFLYYFAKLVAAKEREACAKMFDGAVWSYDYSEIAAHIRARGQA
jgi:hypothetical protein